MNWVCARCGADVESDLLSTEHRLGERSIERCSDRSCPNAIRQPMGWKVHRSY